MLAPSSWLRTTASKAGVRPEKYAHVTRNFVEAGTLRREDGLVVQIGYLRLLHKGYGNQFAR